MTDWMRNGQFSDAIEFNMRLRMAKSIYKTHMKLFRLHENGLVSLKKSQISKVLLELNCKIQPFNAVSPLHFVPLWLFESIRNMFC